MEKSNKTIVGLIIAAIVIIGIVLGTKPATVQVNYTDTGFMPPALQIKIGQTVRFLNDSSSGMWVASGPHPTHTGYPGFDEGQIVFRGSIYEFTFDKLGTWSYHNHINETKMGTIIVK